MKYQVVHYATPVLREKSEPVTDFGPEIVALGKDMLETMREYNGIGLAAQQIGKTLSICVVDVPSDHDVDEDGAPLNPEVEMPLVLCNPEVIETTAEEDAYSEGCLSFPGINGNVTRPVGITVTFQDPLGKEQRLEVDGLLARCIQHEIDHLHGVLFIDHMSPVKRMALKGKLKRLKSATAEEA